jgi:hypothetical protein
VVFVLSSRNEVDIMCFPPKKEKHELVYVLDGCQVRVVIEPKGAEASAALCPCFGSIQTPPGIKMDVYNQGKKGRAPMTTAQLQQLQAAGSAFADRVDVSTVKLDMDAPAAVRAEQYLRQIKNPYAFRCGDVAVNVRFSRDGRTLEQAMQSYLTALAGR